MWERDGPEVTGQLCKAAPQYSRSYSLWQAEASLAFSGGCSRTKATNSSTIIITFNLWSTQLHLSFKYDLGPFAKSHSTHGDHPPPLSTYQPLLVLFRYFLVYLDLRYGCHEISWACFHLLRLSKDFGKVHVQNKQVHFWWFSLLWADFVANTTPLHWRRTQTHFPFPHLLTFHITLVLLLSFHHLLPLPTPLHLPNRPSTTRPHNLTPFCDCGKQSSILSVCRQQWNYFIQADCPIQQYLVQTNLSQSASSLQNPS